MGKALIAAVVVALVGAPAYSQGFTSRERHQILYSSRAMDAMGLSKEKREELAAMRNTRDAADLTAAGPMPEPVAHELPYGVFRGELIEDGPFLYWSSSLQCAWPKAPGRVDAERLDRFFEQLETVRACAQAQADLDRQQMNQAIDNGLVIVDRIIATARANALLTSVGANPSDLHLPR